MILGTHGAIYQLGCASIVYGQRIDQGCDKHSGLKSARNGPPIAAFMFRISFTREATKDKKVQPSPSSSQLPQARVKIRYISPTIQLEEGSSL